MMDRQLKCRIIEVLEEGPASAPYIAKALEGKRTSVAATLSKLAQDGLISVEEREPSGRESGTRAPRVYSLRGEK